jgi:hypothetical protein
LYEFFSPLSFSPLCAGSITYISLIIIIINISLREMNAVAYSYNSSYLESKEKEDCNSRAT